MSELRIGSLFSGYGGLDLAVEEFFGASTAWHCEFDKAPSKVLEYHWPGVPNIGDITAVDWATVEPVDIITGGSPCQDLSAAGARAGMTEGTRSNLWVQMREAIAILKPRFVVWENVRGAYSAKATSSMESCEGCVGESGDAGTVLRALGRVLGDLFSLGYDAEWQAVRASDVGAPHGRYRVFVLAYAAGDGPLRHDGFTGGTAARREGERDVGRNAGCRASADAGCVGGRRGPEESGPGRGDDETLRPDLREAPENSNGAACGEWRESASGQASGGRSWAYVGGRGGASITDTNDDRRESAALSGPVPEVAGTQDDTEIAPHSEGGRRGICIGDDLRQTRREKHASSDDCTPAIGESGKPTLDWGDYAPAISRWESALGRLAPSPVQQSRNGRPQLAPPFVEWMMGLPAGWVTDPAIGLTRNQQLKALGNGVVPQQAFHALSLMWPRVIKEERKAV